jgi:hypothetical protein
MRRPQAGERGWRQSEIAQRLGIQRAICVPRHRRINSTVTNNPGYNPVGIIANPWHPSGALTNDRGGSSDPVSGRLYTVKQSPKTIIIAGGAATKISIDGTLTGLPGSSNWESAKL